MPSPISSLIDSLASALTQKANADIIYDNGGCPDEAKVKASEDRLYSSLDAIVREIIKEIVNGK